LRNQSLLTLEYVGTYAATFTPSFAADFSVGGQSITDESQEVRGQSEGFPGPGMVTLNSGAVTIAREARRRTITGGFFGQALLKFQDRYFVTLGLRVDGNSVFGENFGWQIYPKISGSYVISDESFWPSALGEVKLRAAYGAAGRAPGAFDALRTWNPVSWGGQSAFLPGNRGNPNLGPENTAEIDVGFDGAWFDGRLLADFSYYRRQTSEALVAVGSPASGGGWGSQLENVGELRASGLELALTGTLLEGSSYSWDIGADVSTNHSEVLSLGGLPGFSSGSQTRIEVGYPVPVVRGDLILNPDERAPIDDQRNHNFGPNTPTLIFAPRTTLQLPRGLVLSVRGEYQGGHYLYDGATRWAAATGGILYQCAEAAVDIENGNLDNLTAREHAFCRRENLRNGYFVYPADFFKLRELSLQIPVTEFVPGAANALLTVSGRNLYRWLNDEFTAWDPEVTGWDGVNSFANVIWEQPAPPKLFSMSLRVSF
jgi:outer membrane receptor protein involved in Fe transport